MYAVHIYKLGDILQGVSLERIKNFEFRIIYVNTTDGKGFYWALGMFWIFKFYDRRCVDRSVQSVV